jgi:hypothetical protein
MSKESVSKFLTDLEAAEKLRDFADMVCGSEQQAKVFVRSCKDHFAWDGLRLSLKGENGEALNVLNGLVPDARVMSFLKDNYGFLLPDEKSAAPHGMAHHAIDPALVEQALAGHITAKGAIARALGEDNAGTELFLQAERAKRGGGSDSNKKPSSENPWSKEGWSLTRQGAVYKSDPALAARLAASANSRIGATHPSKV